MIDPSAWDLARLSQAYRSATPFAHVAIDEWVSRAHWHALREAFEEEPADNLQDEIFDVMASRSPPEHPTMRALHASFQSQPVLDAVRVITGQPVERVELRAYAYLPGHYLLPHADRDAGGARRVAFAYYVALLEDLEGGELDLYACEADAHGIGSARVARTLPPVQNRCVLFEVSPLSLHRVREVTRGARLSFAGWFSAGTSA